VRDDIGEFLNRHYFEIAVQVSFTGGFAYADLAVAGTVTSPPARGGSQSRGSDPPPRE
jgi:hypothetical protein